MDEPTSFDLCENQPVTAPTCPTCGYVLRWFATHNAWGCDRCQALMPPAPPMADHSQPISPYAPPIPTAVTDHPSQPYSPFREPSAPVPAPAPPRKSRKGLYLGLAALAAVVTGAIVVAVIIGGGDSKRSRDDVIRQTFAALAAGNEDALHRLADPARTFEKVTRCEKQRANRDLDPLDPDDRRPVSLEADYRDPDKIDERWRKDVRQLLRRTKDAKIEVVDILTEQPPPMGTKPEKPARHDDEDDDDDEDRSERRRRDYDRDYDRDREDDDDRPERDREYKTTTYRKGNEVMPGCYAKAPFRSQLVKVVVDVKEGEREFTQRVKVLLYEIDGDWFLTFPPTLNVGFDVVLSDLQEWRDKVCKCTEVGCVEELDDEYGRLSFAHYALDRKADLPRDMLARMEKAQDERRACEVTARGGPALARYKELKDRLCACTDEVCGRKVELEMMEARRQVESTVRRSRGAWELTRQVSEVARQASECTHKLSRLRVWTYSAYPSSGDLAGGTFVTIRGTGFLATPRTAKVWFGTKQGTVVRFHSDRELVVEVPPAEVEGVVPVRVEFEPGGSHVVPYGFTYRAPAKPTRPRLRPRPKKSTAPP